MGTVAINNITKTNIFYVYAYTDPRKPSSVFDTGYYNGEPCYVGKGKNNRAWVHLSESINTTHNTLKFNKIQRIKDSGADPIITMLAVDLPERDALQLEQTIIGEIRTKWNIRGIKSGPLCNMTGGVEERVDYLRGFCDKFNINYNSLFNTIKRQAPILRGPSKGYQLKRR